MKKSVQRASAIIAGLLLIFSASVSANELPSPGILPGSFFYGIDTTTEKITLALTFDKFNKIEKKLILADERLAEIKALIEQEDKTNLLRAYEEYEGLLKQMEDHIYVFKTDDDSLLKTLQIEAKTKEHRDHVKELQETLNKEEQEEINELLENMLKESDGMEETATQKVEKTKIKEKVTADLTEGDILDITLSFLEEQENESETNNSIFGSKKSMKTSFEVEGSVALSSEAQTFVNEILEKISLWEEEVELELKVKKENDEAKIKEEKIKGSLNEEITSLWIDLKEQILQDLTESDTQEAEVKLEIEHEMKEESSHDEEDEQEEEEYEENSSNEEENDYEEQTSEEEESDNDSDQENEEDTEYEELSYTDETSESEEESEEDSSEAEETEEDPEDEESEEGEGENDENHEDSEEEDESEEGN